MDISKLDVNFLKSTESLEDKEVYSVLNEPFELYGVSYDNENKCFVRAPYELAKSISKPLEVLNTCTTGGRVRFTTNSKKIVIAVKYRYTPQSIISIPIIFLIKFLWKTNIEKPIPNRINDTIYI